MHAAGQDNATPLGYRVLARSEVGDDQHLEIIACNGLGQGGTPHDRLVFRPVDAVEELDAVSKSVWVAHGYVDDVVIVLQSEFEAERVVLLDLAVLLVL